MTPRPPGPATRVIQREDGSPSLLLRRATLRVESAPETEGSVIGQTTEFAGSSLRIGSGDDNDLVLVDAAVSARHFTIVATDQGFILEDRGSTNGTWVDGYRVRSIFLPETATIRVGDSVLHFAASEEERAVEISRRTNFGSLLGHSPEMQAAFAVLEQAAKSDATVLVVGESGTGKELAARGLHELSTRADGAYVVFDCGATTTTLLESQLFGHAKGSFTGATEARQGVFEAADGGTLVLDELGELPLELQPKLLRALETRQITRLGENKPRTVSVRFVACTNRNLEEEVRAGRFRKDLFFRLSVINVRLPPLRERREEIPRLLRHFLGQMGGNVADVPASLRAMLENHDWPGNVRELRNFAERYLALPGARLEDLLPGASTEDHRALEIPRPGAPQPMPFHEAKRRRLEAFEMAYLEELFRAHGGNISAAARAAGLSRQSCYRLMHKYGLAEE